MESYLSEMDMLARAKCIESLDALPKALRKRVKLEEYSRSVEIRENC